MPITLEEVESTEPICRGALGLPDPDDPGSGPAPQPPVNVVPLEVTFTVEEAITDGHVIAWGTTGVVPASSVLATDRHDVFGIATENQSVGLEVKTATAQLKVETLFAAAPLVGDVGKAVYLSATPGLATLTPTLTSGHRVVFIGILVEGDGVKLNPLILYQPIPITRIL